MRTLYHITSAAESKDAADAGVYEPRAFEAEGFIHCSYLHQVCDVANRRFAGRAGLVLLAITRAKLSCAVIDENLEGGADLFPHIYGRLPMTAVAQVHPFPCGANGRFDLPDALKRG